MVNKAGQSSSQSGQMVKSGPKVLAGHANSQVDPYSQARLPPQSIEAEQSVLGGVMLDNDKWDPVLEEVDAVDFYRHEHRLIFQAIKKLASNQLAIL